VAGRPEPVCRGGTIVAAFFAAARHDAGRLSTGAKTKLLRASSGPSSVLDVKRRQPGEPPERFPAEWNHSVEKKSLQIQKLEHILIAQIDST
jgi:hypothetical protein